MRKLLWPTVISILLWAGSPVAMAQTGAQSGSDAPRRVLVAALYPYIPNAGAAYFMIEEEFERANPDIDLQINLLNDGYYDDEADAKNILNEQADVYELDSVFLADFIEAKKIAPLGPAFKAEEAGLVPFARAAASQQGTLWGMPHWLCGNFLFYRTGDTQIGQAKTLGDLEQAIATVGEPRWLIADFAGSSTLGEMYLDAAMDATGSSRLALDLVSKPDVDAKIANDMKRAIKLIRPYFGRDEDYHDNTGFYARQFARGAGRAYVGYSEQLFFLLSETTLSCRRDEGCLQPEDIQVAQWPLADRGSSPIGWVDILAIDARAAGQKRADAEALIQFLTSEKIYLRLLMPEWPNPPRYLLPARDSLYSNPGLLDAAPLYRKLRPQIANSTPITALGLNARLRDAGRSLKKSLPPR